MKIVTLADPEFTQHVRKRLFMTGGVTTPGHIEYFKSYYEHDFTDLSFGVIHPKGEIICLLTRHLVNGLPHYGWYGQPAKLYCQGDGEEQSQAERVAQAYINTLWQDGSFIDFLESTGEMNFLSKALLQMEVVPRVFPEQVIKMASDALMLSDMRKVFRQNINWGARNLECVVLDADSVTEEDFHRFEEFHIKVSGRRTRSHASWVAQMNLVLSGENYLVTSNLSGSLVGMSLFAASGERAYYSVGVYERSLFHFPLSHYPIWLGIVHARNMGCQEFSMGESVYAGVTDSFGRLPSEKECNISHFKRGFGGDIRAAIRLSGHLSV